MSAADHAVRAEDILRRQGEALARGRARINAQRQREAQHLRALIFDLAAADTQAGNPRRDRAGRVHRKLPKRPDGRRLVGARLVRKILAAIQHSVADSLARNRGLGENNQ